MRSKEQVIGNFVNLKKKFNYRNDPKFSDRQVWANSADPDQTAPHCLQFHLHVFDKIPSGLVSFFEF